MNAKKALAGSIVALLLAVTSAAAACDVSCAFALASADCHSSEAPSDSSMSAAMEMDGMDMPGMAMPSMATGQMPAPNSAISRAHSGHPEIGDMGPCERQSCDKGLFVFVKGRSSETGRASSAVVVGPISATDVSPQTFYDVRNDATGFRTFPANPPTLILRV